MNRLLKLTKADEVSVLKDCFVATDYKDDVLTQVILSNVDGADVPSKIDKKILKLISPYSYFTFKDNEIINGTRKIQYIVNTDVDDVIEVENYLTTINSIEELKELLNCKYAMAKDDSRAVLGGICINGNEFAALDGFRIAIRKGNFKAKEQIIMHRQLVDRISKIKKYNGEIKIYYNYKFVKFVFGDLSVIGNRIDGEFFKYKSIIPKEYNTKVKLETKELLDILKLYQKNKFELVKFDIKDEVMTITSSNEIATVEDELNIQLQGEPIKLAFNVNYLIDVLKNSDEEITLKMTSPVSPMIVETESKLEFILPFRIN